MACSCFCCKRLVNCFFQTLAFLARTVASLPGTVASLPGRFRKFLASYLSNHRKRLLTVVVVVQFVASIFTLTGAFLTSDDTSKDVLIAIGTAFLISLCITLQDVLSSQEKTDSLVAALLSEPVELDRTVLVRTLATDSAQPLPPTRVGIVDQAGVDLSRAPSRPDSADLV
ncbi:hypothetical protein CAOG_000956 [Capsaspora owczarzaki ATCC 30864]|uniref:Uncharacterized protein n=1 Tax=Capsaspora owczarzaki (strain ATCC 30864) TaxID=595528 RepID=A0A0D2X0R1_CAPO3|nr:hypothetical protein CAOG_000956 [Capsaspora owczarzaki ATCC 30864]